jgi:diadenosine tetraphosphate (Ap4A) HIT family hydrolase
MVNCCFCHEFLHHEVSDEIKNNYSVTNRILFDNDKFVVLPSVSPIVKNHLLVLPKKHINTMKQLKDDEKSQLRMLVNNITHLLGEDYFAFEHGAFPVNGNTCGVDHAHIHILPVGREISKKVIGFIKRTYTYMLYKDFLLSLDDEKDKPYLLFGNDMQKMYSCNNALFQSQFIRKLLCDNMGIADWNWRSYTNKHNFIDTLGDLTGKIHNARV